MTSSDRRSRFREAVPVVTPADGDQIVSPAERRRRWSSWNALFTRLAANPREYAVHVEQYGLLADREDRNDAVASVEFRVDGWLVRWVLAEQDRTLVPRALHLEPENRLTQPGGITADLIRELSPAAAVAAANSFDPGDTAWAGPIMRWVRGERHAYGPAYKAGERHGQSLGRPRVPDHELANIAELYLQEAPMGTGLTKRLAAELRVPEETARDRIRMARQRGFLTPTKRGRRGGQAGPALIAMREQATTHREANEEDQ